jgi:Ser/Thr protein kinase RdoA (MazF antagonist)
MAQNLGGGTAHQTMNREGVVELCNRRVLGRVARRFGVTRDDLVSYPSYEGCQNLVYDYECRGRPLILRISFRSDRPIEQIQAELHFINYLADRGVRVAKPVPSRSGSLIEPLTAEGVAFLAVSFVKGRGMRVPDNRYRYREGVPMEEYYQNWGHLLGQMHALAKDYAPPSPRVNRPEWYDLDRARGIDRRVPERLSTVRTRFKELLAQIRDLPRDRDSYGLIHGDFNDGNFTVDYDNGDITVFDFDDACYFWFMYELACAWEGGVGRTMFSGVDDRRSFMSHYFDNVLEGYNRANSLPAGVLEQLPLFLKVVEMEEFLHYVQYIDEADEELQGRLQYKIRCIEDQIPYLGFFDTVFSPRKPFSM